MLRWMHSTPPLNHDAEQLVRRDAVAATAPVFLAVSLGCIIGSFLLAALLGDAISDNARLGWLATMFIVESLVLIISLSYLRNAARWTEDRWVACFLTLNVMQALLWSTLPLYTQTGAMNIERWYLVIMFLCACSAAGVVTLAAQRQTCVGYLLALWLPMAAQLAALHTVHTTLLAVSATVFLALVIVFALFSNRTLLSAMRSSRRLEYQATHDVLTGLPNRRVLLEHADDAARLATREGPGYALLFVDLDRFKQVNDVMGHALGDELLRQVATRLKSVIREHDIVSRLGGDEFVMLLRFVSQAAAVHLAERLRASFEQPFELNGQEVAMTASIGVAWSDGRTTAPQLLMDSDVAMYRAKEFGRHRVAVFDGELARWGEINRGLEHDLRRCITNASLHVVGQPIVALDSGRAVGVELLARWNRAGHGPVSPAIFTPVAEEAGMIIDLGRWMLREAATIAARWSRHPQLSALRIGVNISPKHLVAGDLVADVKAAIGAANAPARALCLELTETSSPKDLPRLQATLHALRELGITIAIDDFGAGWSSLTYLHTLPASQVKIDRSFIMGIEQDRRAQAIVRATAEMTAVDERELVAEGIETAAQARVVWELGCRYAQGYLYGRPTTILELEDMLLMMNSDNQSSPSIIQFPRKH